MLIGTVVLPVDQCFLWGLNGEQDLATRTEFLPWDSNKLLAKKANAIAVLSRNGAFFSEGKISYTEGLTVHCFEQKD